MVKRSRPHAGYELFKIQSYQTAAMQAAPVLEAAAEKEAMFRNAGCFSDAVKINVEQIFSRCRLIRRCARYEP